MKRLIRNIGMLLKYGTFFSTLGFVGAILIQIFARLFLPTAPSWTEEAARIFFVLAIGCSAGLALRSGDYVNFDFLSSRLSKLARQRLMVCIDLLTVLLFAIFTLSAFQFVVMGWGERSPSLKIPMAFPFAGILMLGFSLLVYAVQRLYNTVRSLGKEAPHNHRHLTNNADPL